MLTLNSLSCSCFNLFKQQTLSTKFLHNPKFSNRFHSKSYTQSQTEANSLQKLQSLIHALTSCSTLNVRRIIHAITVKSLNYNDAFIGDRLVCIYGKLNCFGFAESLFDDIPEKDLVSWNSFISAFSRKGDVVISLVSACTNIDQGRFVQGVKVKTGLLFDSKVVNSLINIYGKFGCLESACDLFESCGEPNLVSWNSIVRIYVENGLGEESIRCFGSMRRVGLNPDQATMVTLLRGCADIGVGKLAYALHGYLLRSSIDIDSYIMTAFLSVYVRLGRLGASHDIFMGMKDLDSIAWTAMLAGYTVHGHGRDAISLFKSMVEKGHPPDHVTFTHLLSACGHSGLVKEGNRYFEIMYTTYKVKPRLEHYSCMVDLMGLSGHLNEAYMLIKSMPMEPNCAVWGALLNACRVYGNVELGQEVAERLFALNPSDPRNYIMLSSIYSKGGHRKNVSKVRALMKKRDLIRTPGCSFIEHGQKIHHFMVGDRLHPDTERIYVKLEEVIKKLQKAGYVPNTEFFVHDVDDNVKANMISKHSEKLAIAFGLLVAGSGIPLVITKNPRICGDCHSMAEFVSLTESHMIIIRDAGRFHHFADGLCSCGDYW